MKKPSRSKVGRPTKFDQRFCNLLFAHMSNGYSFETFGTVAEVSVQTLYNWEKSRAEFFEAKTLGEEASLLWWESVGIQGTFQKGFNAGLWIQNMKCRFRKFGWNPRPHYESAE